MLDKANELKNKLSDLRVLLDDNEAYSPGWKFNQWEMKGVPVRIEIGPKDIENGQCVIARRDTSEKISVSLDEVENKVKELLDEIQSNMYNKALKHREEHTKAAKDMDEFKKVQSESLGFVKAMWCGCTECEEKIKEETGATLRCVPFKQEDIGSDTCVYCGKKADKLAYFARAY